MGRLPLVDPDDPGADQRAADLLRVMRAATGRDFAVLQTVANHPEALERLVGFLSVAYANNTLTPGQRELAYLGLAAAADVEQLSIAMMASLRGGFLLSKTSRSLRPLEIALDSAFDCVKAVAVHDHGWGRDGRCA